MQPIVLAILLDLSTTSLLMSTAIVALLAIGLFFVRRDLVAAKGVEKVVALTYLCMAVPLAAFGAEHFGIAQSMVRMVPSYMPAPTFWIYFVGVALIAASLSMATKIQVQWSGVGIGAMMFLFVAMLYLPGVIKGAGRITWTIVFRETSFGSAGWVLAGLAMGRKGKPLVNMGRVLIGITALVFGVLHFFYPLALPGVPLLKEMPTWIPARPVVDYATGAFLVIAGVCFLLGKKARTAATYLGAWIVLMVVTIYVPVMIGALASPKADVQLEGLNYFADTLLFGGVILSVASATREDS